MSVGHVYFIKFVLYLPKWARGDKKLCSTLVSHPVAMHVRQSLHNKVGCDQLVAVTGSMRHLRLIGELGCYGMCVVAF